MNEMIANVVRAVSNGTPASVNLREIANAFCWQPFGTSRGFHHYVYSGASSTDIERWESQAGSSIPKVFKDVLTQMNGTILFLGALNLNGIDIAREPGRPGIRQPFTPLEYNVLSRPAWLRPEWYVIGSYTPVSSLLVLEAESDTGRTLQVNSISGVLIQEFRTPVDAIISLAEKHARTK